MTPVTFWLLVSGVIFLLLDLIIVLVYCFIKSHQRNSDKKKQPKVAIQYFGNPFYRKQVSNEKEILSIDGEFENFEIPGRTMSTDGTKRTLLPKNSLVSKKSDPNNTFKPEALDARKYSTDDIVSEETHEEKSTKYQQPCIKLKLNHSMYDVRVTLIQAFNIKVPKNERVSISVSIASLPHLVYYSGRFDGPDPVFHEEFLFPVVGKNPIVTGDTTLSLDVWSVDSQWRKKCFGYVEMMVKDVVGEMLSIVGRNEVIREVTLSGDDTNRSKSGEILLCVECTDNTGKVQVAGVDQVAFTEMQTRCALVWKNEEIHVVKSDVAPTKKIDFTHILPLCNPDGVPLNRVLVKLEIFTRQTKLGYTKQRHYGHVLLGNARDVGKYGREHWALSQRLTHKVKRWHTLVLSK